MAQHPQPPTDDQLTAIRRRLERITEPPWEMEQPYTSLEIYSIPRSKRAAQVSGPTVPEHWPLIGTVGQMYDAEFIMNAPTDMRA